MTKRRCAGCNRVIDGRPNKLYCSTQCRARMRQQRHRGRAKQLIPDVTPLAAVPAVIRSRSNGALIAAVARLGYLGRPDDTVLDVTYGRGLWWTRYRPAWLIEGKGDFRDRPEVDGSVPVVCFDPPYISTGSRGTSTIDAFYARYGLGEIAGGWCNTRQLMDDGLVECARILSPGGYLLVKCMDYVEGGRKIWNTFHVFARAESLDLRLIDRFIHVNGGGPVNPKNLDGSPRQQKRAREVSSMLLVLTK